MNIFMEGEEVAMFYGWKTDGIFQTGDTMYSINGSMAEAGDVKVLDLNGDGQVDINDRTIIGNPNPPRKPVLAGSTASIASIPGSAEILISKIPEIIIAAMLYVLIFDFSNLFKINLITNTITTMSHKAIKISKPPALQAS